MLLGCGCQCVGGENSVPSQSTPPSVSASASGSVPAVIESSGCQSCVGGVGPTVYQCSWSYTGTTQGGSFPCCATYSGQSTYRLYRRTEIIPAGCCIWGSNEPTARGVFVDGAPVCQLTASTPPYYYSRVVLYMGNLLSCQPSPGASVNLRVRVNYEFRPFQFSWVEYILPDGPGQQGPYNCLSPMALQVVKRQNLAWPFGGQQFVKMWSATTFGGGSAGPCWSNPFTGEDPGIPDTLTITPVAA